MRKLVGSFLDYGELAQPGAGAALGQAHGQAAGRVRETLRELVERSYLKQVHGNANYNIKYDKEIKDGSEANVTGVLNTVARGKKVKIALEYKMLWRGDHWVVYDVVTDEQSMLENYRAEFNKIINKEGFDALMKRMKKKLDEKEENEACARRPLRAAGRSGRRAAAGGRLRRQLLARSSIRSDRADPRAAGRAGGLPPATRGAAGERRRRRTRRPTAVPDAGRHRRVR